MPPRFTLAQLQRLAAKNKCKCLSTHYRNIKSLITWCCANGHLWRATAGYVKRGYWCPYCVGQKRINIEQYQTIARQRGGRCLSPDYVKAASKLHFECAQGHRWWATANSVKSGHWCSICGRERTSAARRFKLEDLKRYALDRGGECLATAYVNRDQKVLWQCSCGNRWLASTASVLAGHWCPKCGVVQNTKGRLARNRLADLRSLALSRGGLCLSTEYQGMSHHLRWRCASMHEWRAKPNDIVRGGWCPECSSGVGERICRAYFEQLFGGSFPLSSPDWLRNAKGRAMQLDGFAPDLKLAFEHHGMQHYDTSTPFVRDKSTFDERHAADELKAKLCEEQGVVLITIPEVPTLTSLSSLRQVIADQCTQRGITLSVDYYNRPIDLRDAYSPSFIAEMRSIAKSRRGRCLSKAFIGWNLRMLWECALGHRWMSTPTSVKHQGTWCRICAHRRPLTIADLEGLAESYGGKCLSKRYMGSHQNHIWQCLRGHVWRAMPTNVQAGHWCPKCAGCQRLTLDEMNRIALERGGKCRSKAYVNSRSSLVWQCAQGHVWTALPINVKNKGSWCPQCSLNKRAKRKDDI
jgi:hypothetical protein